MSSSRKFLLEMACLRSVWRRTNLLPRQFWMLERPVLRANKDDTGTDCLNSSPLTRGVHSQARRLDFLLERKKHTSFARPLGPGFFLCRHMSSKPGECSNKIDCNPAVVEELVPEESLEAVVTQVISVNEAALAAADSSLPVAAIQHFIDSVHAFTGFNWIYTNIWGNRSRFVILLIDLSGFTEEGTSGDTSKGIQVGSKRIIRRKNTKTQKEEERNEVRGQLRVVMILFLSIFRFYATSSVGC
ncbi:PREDICTED: mitochondrial inner membrane protein OXA1-like isoform X2 [Tarenaya hassleriana]|uniref:mitochondrial inner membrane protein OXA1-like isoform X2 n=1 Tax=Tarenaya hassleriana TaxID=28532 RepID=UPI00053C0ABF|nr:PREDICTED: mitochondrial inner membrane protein OXA1-like isoform X2 [Tarenaya hassleriana]